MADWFDGVEVFVEVAWDDPPLTAIADCTWTDETAYARTSAGINISRGRRSELSPVGPGSMTVQFDNRTRRFDVANTAGALYGKLLPMRNIRVYTIRGGVTCYLFTGYILGFPITYPGMTDSVVTVECVDGFRVLQQSALPASAYATEVVADDDGFALATLYFPMQEGSVAGVLANASLIAPEYATDLAVVSGSAVSSDFGVPVGASQMLAGGFIAHRGSALSYSAAISMEMWVGGGTDLVAAGSGVGWYPYLSLPGSGIGVGGDNWFKVTPLPSTVVVNFSYDTGGSGYGDSSSSADGVTFNLPTNVAGGGYHLAVTVSPTTITVYVNGSAIGTDTLSGSGFTPTQGVGMVVAPGDVRGLSHVAIYQGTTLTADQVKAHYLAGLFPFGHPYGERTGGRADRILDSISWPAADVDLSTGETFCGDWLPNSTTALAALRELESSEQGLLFMSADGKVTLRDRQWFMTNTANVTAQATFGDTGSDIPYQAVKVDGNQIDFVRNAITLTYPGGTVTTKDSSSVTAYGAQSDAVDANAMPAGASWLARNLTAWRLRLRKDPATRVPSITIPMRNDMATCYPVAALELGDRVVVNRNPTGGAGSISVKCTVQGIDHQITGDDWKVGLYLAPALENYTEAPYLICDIDGSIYTAASGAQYVSIPDAAAYTPTTSLDVRTVIKAADWTPAFNRQLCGHYNTTGNLRAWQFRLSNSGPGNLRFHSSADGTTDSAATSSVTLPSVTTLVDATTKIAIRALWEAATPSVKFYYKVLTEAAYAAALSDSGWTQLGSTVTGAGVAASIYDSSTALTIAGNQSAGADAYCYATVVKVDGTLQAGFDADADIPSAAASTLTITTGQTATVTSATLAASAPYSRIGTTAGNLVAA
jgi:hypothetical protein